MPPKTTAPPAFRITPDLVLTVAAAWLIPGAGHWLLGYRIRGTILGACLLGLFWVGQALACPAIPGGRPIAVSRQASPIFFPCQLGNGFSTLISQKLWGPPRTPNETKYPIDANLPRYYNLGILFTSVSGLLNYLLLLHMFDPRTWRQAAQDRGQGSSPAQNYSRRGAPGVGPGTGRSP
ncbi:MAG TPA: DUF6677 family protein [Planctomycetota bacterium]|nr:DUF6677 family protein [Planctomycetota bacterium]